MVGWCACVREKYIHTMWMLSNVRIMVCLIVSYSYFVSSCQVSSTCLVLSYLISNGQCLSCLILFHLVLFCILSCSFGVMSCRTIPEFWFYSCSRRSTWSERWDPPGPHRAEGTTQNTCHMYTNIYGLTIVQQEVILMLPHLSMILWIEN